LLALEKNELPKGWLLTSLNEVSEIILGQSPPSSTYNKEQNGLPFFQGKADFGILYPTPRIWCNKPKKIAEKNDVLLSVRAPVGPTNLCQDRSCIGRGIASVRSIGNIPSKYLLYFLRYIEKDLDRQGTGTTFKAISGNKVKSIIIPIPPLNEQKRIVSKIDELFSIIPHIEKLLIENINKFKLLEKIIIEFSFKNSIQKLDPKKIKLSEIFSLMHGDFLPKNKMKNGEIPVYGGNGVVGYHNEKNYEGDVLIIGRVGAQCGNVHSYSGKLWFTDNTIGLIPKIKINLKFFSYQLKNLELNKLSAGTGQPYISRNTLLKLHLYQISLDKQKEIVEIIEKLILLIENSRKNIRYLFNLLSRIKIQILEQAFDGKLVPQDPNDEPASELLKKIKLQIKN